ncbi:DUF2059 domain-containing protein [Algoriphagus hitonicola]|uniref:DUF2059 domain-containing protein n=1 Tax=Algoriphagus hitonicola TaxID=435880 RepID=A0A1I2PXM1_9BACT|nr:DUF2059 domain-containing protein [Algoriphagus hitonicola]SFG20133.1 hypothetical protein SAMN04487988_1028 [Algoriphagus hitonicola]
MKLLVFSLVLFCLFFPGISKAQSDETANRLMEVMEISDSMSGMVDMMKQNPAFSSSVPTEFWDEFKKVLTSEELIAEVAEVYKKYYSEDEMIQLIEFYTSPIGKKTLKINPQLSGETMQIGQKYSIQVVQKLMEKSGTQK